MTDASRTAGQPLPEALAGLFWEYDFDDLSWEEERDLIVGRVLAATGPVLTFRGFRLGGGTGLAPG